MKSAAFVAHPVLADPPRAALWAGAGDRLSAYVALTKPRVAALVLVTVAVGFLVGERSTPNPPAPWKMLVTMVGTALVAAGASAWNQYLERALDGRMKRTAARPLPSGRIAPVEAAVLGTTLAAVGTLLLALGASGLAAVVAAATFVLYVSVYTPLKTRTTLNTAVVAIPGALPPIIGWSAATDRLGIEAWALFLIVYLWQFPHFLAIAWIYREDYTRAGHKMLPAVDPRGLITGRQAAGYALALVPAGLLPASVGLAGSLYFAGALALGLFYLACAVLFWSEVSEPAARRLLRASLVYLPAVLLLLLLNPTPV